VRELESVIEHGLLERFKRIAAARGGVALTTISNGSCEACHVRLRPQLIAEVRTHRDIILCENCSRILYYVPPPPAPSS
jgi:predicted  nucleic acid-binding Zn-ribbon protein